MLEKRKRKRGEKKKFLINFYVFGRGEKAANCLGRPLIACIYIYMYIYEAFKILNIYNKISKKKFKI